jgi:anti-anti-sigma factor
MRLGVSTSIVAGRPVISLTGTLDLSSVPALHMALSSGIIDHPANTICVDLQGVDAVDDVALGVLLGAAGRARRGSGELVVVTTDDALRQRLALTGFDRAITVTTSLTAAPS